MFLVSKNTTRSKKILFSSLDHFSDLYDFSDICLQYIFSYIRGRRYLCLAKLIYLKDQDVRKLEDLLRVTSFICPVYARACVRD